MMIALLLIAPLLVAFAEAYSSGAGFCVVPDDIATNSGMPEMAKGYDTADPPTVRPQIRKECALRLARGVRSCRFRLRVACEQAAQSS